METQIDWSKEIQPLINKYKGTKFPLDYRSNYQLLVMVILSAQDSNKNINNLSPAFFNKFPDFKSLSEAKPDDLFPYIQKVRNFSTKSRWLIEVAQKIKDENNIPVTLEQLTKLPGIGRKSARTILREMTGKSDGVYVDLHVVRVATRLGLTTNTDPKKIEVDIGTKISKDQQAEAGFSISFLGIEICRPTNPKHGDCVMNKVCPYYLDYKNKIIEKN